MVSILFFANIYAMKFAIITDIHENVTALRDAMGQIEKAKCDEVVCLGDITGFAPKLYLHFKQHDANECISIIRSNCKYVVGGNHDYFSVKMLTTYHLANNLPVNWYQLTDLERQQVDAKVWTYQEEIDPELNTDSVEFLSSLPEKIELNIDNQNIMFSHFLMPDITGSTNLFPKRKEEFGAHFDYIEQNAIAVSFVGHGHIRGFLSATRNKISFREFGYQKLKRKPHIIILPSLSNLINGFCIFETETMELFVTEI